MMTLIHRLRKRSGTYIYHNQAQYCLSPQMNNLRLRHYISIRQRYCTSLHLQSLTRILGDEKQFWAVIGVRPDPELAGLRVQGELVKSHRADEGDVGGLAVQHVLVRVYPQARQLWQHVDHFIRLEVVDENVGQPEVLDELQVHGHHHVLCRVVWPKWGAEGGEHVQPSLPPLHVEVGGEGDAVVLVVDAQDLVDVDGHAYHVCLFCECRGWEKDRWKRAAATCIWKLKFWIIVGKAEGLWDASAAFESWKIVMRWGCLGVLLIEGSALSKVEEQYLPSVEGQQSSIDNQDCSDSLMSHSGMLITEDC